eukprot:c5249_g1_i1.p1 GENE.c5249_g1_i1~~c5249_g1_i1.p1  ORF type:complete len:269 (+),score=40.67 c5249_g1_i1:42-848(+)
MTTPPKAFQATVPNLPPGATFQVNIPGSGVVPVTVPYGIVPGTLFTLAPFEVRIPNVNVGSPFTVSVQNMVLSLVRPKDKRVGDVMYIHVPQFPAPMPMNQYAPRPPASYPPPFAQGPPLHCMPNQPPPNQQQPAQTDQFLHGLKHQLKSISVGEIDPDEVPNEFICPITQEIMTNPVIAMDGFSYEQEAIERWFVDHKTSPKTNQPLPNTMTIPNQAMRTMLMEFVAERKKREESRQPQQQPPAPQHDELGAAQPDAQKNNAAFDLN